MPDLDADWPDTYAVGVRIVLADAPAEVLAVVADVLGEPITDIREVRGGMAPGAVAVVRGGSGRAVFVKAVGCRTNERNVELYRLEAGWGARLPHLPGIVRPLTTRDLVVDGEDWVVTVFPAVDGVPPRHPWRPDELIRVLDAWAPLGRAFTPSPYDDVSADGLVAFFSGWRQIADDPDDPWRPHAETWLERETAFVDALRTGTTFAHSDLRADNVLLSTDGSVQFVDWVHAHLAPQWLDPLLIACDVVASGADTSDGGQVDMTAVWSHPAFCGADPTLLLSGLAGFAGTMHAFSRKPSPPGLPTIRAWQVRQSEAVLRYLGRQGGPG